MKSFFVLILCFFGVSAVFAAGSHHGEHHHGLSSVQSSSGVPGQLSEVSRVIDVSMHDSMVFSPSRISVLPGETVQFVITNMGQLPHEFSIGSAKEQSAHAKMMSAMSSPMDHDDGQNLSLKPGEEGVIVWKFGSAADIEIACHVVGHYAAGMRIAVETLDGV